MSVGRTILETERLVLREMTRDDFDVLCRTLQDEGAMYAYEGAFSDDEAVRIYVNGGLTLTADPARAAQKPAT